MWRMLEATRSLTFTERAATIRSHSFIPTGAVTVREGAFGMVNTGARVGERLRAIRRQKGLVAARRRSSLEPRVQGVGARRVRARRAGDLGAAACCAWPRSTRSRPISCCRASSKARSASSTRAAAAGRPERRVHDRPRAPARARRSRRADPLTASRRRIQLERQDFNGRMLTIRRSDLRVLASVHGPPHRRARRPARAARPAGRRGLSPASPASGADRAVDPRLPCRALATSTHQSTRRTVKILVPGNHLMVGLLGQRDELLRLVEGGVPGADPRARQRDHDHRRQRRHRTRRSPVRGDGRAARAGPRARPREPRPLDRDAEGRPAPERGADHRGRARPQDRPPEDGRAEALRRRGARQHDHVRRSARPAPARATSRSRSRCRRSRRRK